MSYTATATPPGERSSINKFFSQIQTPSVQQLYLDAAAARVAEDEEPPPVHPGHLGAPSHSGSCLDLATLPKLLEGSAGEHEGARKSDAELEECSTHPQGRMLAGFYQRQNVILDSWQEVDEILFSPFPNQVLNRFISKDQMRQIRERKTLHQKVSLGAAGLPSQAVAESDSEPEHSPTISPVSFSARKRNFKRPIPSRREALSTERKHLLDDDHDPNESSSNYGSFTNREGLTNGYSTHGGAKPNATSTAPTSDKLGAPFSHSSRSHGIIVEMPSEESHSARSSFDPTTNHVDNAHVAVDMDDTGHEAGSSADEDDTDDDSCRRHTLSAGAHPLLAAGSPDGKRESERQRLMSHVPGLAEKDEASGKQVQFAISINLATNVALLMALDLLSTLIIFATSKLIAHRSFQTVYKYPVGKRRFEPLGVVIFSVLMIASFFQVLLESSGRLWACLHGEMTEVPSLPLGGIGMMLITVVLKAIMWIKYRTSPSSGVRAVAQDAENDVVFNIVSLTFPRSGQALGAPALDPLGGILLSLYIIREWSITLIEQVTKLSGKACGSQEIARALYLVTRFKDVQSVSNLEVYHAGDGTIIEADVVLPYDLSLKEAHDVGEVLTFALECLPDVERAYVHLDYNAHGPMGHLAQRG